MITAEFLAAVLVLSVPLAYLGGRLTTAHLLIAAFGIGAAFCWFDAAVWGALARVAGRRNLIQANSLIWATATVVGIAAPAVAGLFAAAWNSGAVLAADACTCLVSIVLLRRIVTTVDAPDSGARRSSARADILTGLGFLWRQPVIRTLSLTGFGLSTTAGDVLGLLAVHASAWLPAPPRCRARPGRGRGLPDGAARVPRPSPTASRCGSNSRRTTGKAGSTPPVT